MEEKINSNNLKYFPDAPVTIKPWERSFEFNLAFSVILELQDRKDILQKIETLQNEIIEMLPFDVSDSPCLDDVLAKKVIIYKYPSINLHFTLINFIKCKFKNLEQQHRFKEFLLYVPSYKTIKNEIICLINKKINIISNVSADLRWIYTGDKNGIDSISLQVFTGQDFIQKLHDEILQNAKLFIHSFEPQNEPAGVKAKPDVAQVAFTLNILRFMGNSDDSKFHDKNTRDNFKKKIKEINERHNKFFLSKPLKIKRFDLVESDAFLYEYKTLENWVI